MNLEMLELFCEVVRQKSFSAGAKAMGVSQSAASQSISHLEEELDVPLLDRKVRPFALTKEGELYYEGLRNILEEHTQLLDRIRSMRAAVMGHLHVAAIYSAGLDVMHRYIHEFMSSHPEARIRLEYMRPNKVIEAVQNEEVDLGIISYPMATRKLEVIPLRNEPMALACSSTHPLASKSMVTLKELEQEQFVSFDRDLPIRKTIDRMMRKSQVKLQIALEFDNIEMIKKALQVGNGVAILPEPTMRDEIRQGILAAVPLSIKDLVRPIGFIKHRQKPLSTTATAFIELLLGTTRELNAK